MPFHDGQPFLGYNKHMIIFGLLHLVAFSLQAQGCGDTWDKPFICRVEAYVSLNGKAFQRLSSNQVLHLPLGSNLQIRFKGWDQWGHAYPEDKWIMLCEEKFQETPLVRFARHTNTTWTLQVSSHQGKTVVFCFIPGNQNVTFPLRLVVSPLKELTRKQATFLATCLYRAILGRDPDPSGLASATLEVLRGKIKPLVDSMFYSKEFKKKRKHLPASQLLEDFYQGILGRPVDGEGAKKYLHRLEKHHYSETIMRILASEEFQKRLLRVR